MTDEAKAAEAPATPAQTDVASPGSMASKPFGADQAAASQSATEKLDAREKAESLQNTNDGPAKEAPVALLVPAMPRYRSHKTVQALEIAAINDNVLSFEGGYGNLATNKEMWARYKPVVGDFYVVYADGYASFSPRQAFLDGYVRIAPAADGMSMQDRAHALVDTYAHGLRTNSPRTTTELAEMEALLRGQ